MKNSQHILQTLQRGFQLRCPRCGEQSLFAGYFSMHAFCRHCHLQFEQEAGYFVGAIYINYGLTTGIAILGFFLLEYFMQPSITQQLLLWGAFSLFFPLCFFRYSKSLWLNIDYFFNPVEEPAVDAGEEVRGEWRSDEQ